MPYTPLDQKNIYWDERGSPYWLSTDGKNTKHYIPPIVAAQYQDDPRMLQWAAAQGFELTRDDAGEITGMNQAPGAGAGGNRPLDFRTGREWDPKTGKYKTKFDWGDVVTLGAGGIVGMGAAAAASGAGAGSGAIAAPTAAQSQAGIASLAGSGMAGGTAGGTAATLGVAAPAAAAPAAAPAATSGGSWSKLAGMAGRGLGAAADQSAANRGSQLEAQFDEADVRLKQDKQYRDALVQREQEGRNSGNDAWRRLAQAEHVAGRTSDYAPANVTTAGQTRALPSFGFGPKASTATQQTAAASMRDEVMKRLQGGNPIPEVQQPTPFTMDPSLVKGSKWEKIAGGIAPFLTAWGGR